MQNKLLPVSPKNKTPGMYQGLSTMAHKLQLCSTRVMKCNSQKLDRLNGMYLSGIVNSNGDVEPQNSAQKQRNFHHGKGHVHQATALAKTGSGGVADGRACKENLNGNIKKQHGDAHAELQQLADVDKEFVLREMRHKYDSVSLHQISELAMMAMSPAATRSFAAVSAS